MTLGYRFDQGLALGIFFTLAALPDAGFALGLRDAREGTDAHGEGGKLLSHGFLRLKAPVEPAFSAYLAPEGRALRQYAVRTGRDIPVAAGRNTSAATVTKPLSYTAILALLFGIPILLAVGFYLRGRYRENLRKITSTLAEVGHGRFDARISTNRQGFGLAEVTTKINALLDHQQNLARSLNHASAEIAHTLKRPLIGLRQRLEHARDRALDEAHFSELVGAAIAEIDSMVTMFEAILDIAQIEAGDFRSRFAELELKAVLLKLVDVYEAVIQDSGHKLVVKLDGPKNTTISGDFNLLFQMFNNLIENAILYCPAGATISIDLTGNGDEIVAIIADNGPGLSAEDRLNVFRPFFRPETTQQTPGHGLGIPFAAAIVRLHRARIVLGDNQPGLRASVHFWRVRPEHRKGHRVARDAISASGRRRSALPAGLAPLDHPPEPSDGGYVYVKKEENSPN